METKPDDRMTATEIALRRDKFLHPESGILRAISIARESFVERLVAANDPAEKLHLYLLAKEIAASVREWAALAEADIIGQHPDLNVQTDTARYSVGTVKDTKCRDVRATLEALFEATGGDWEAVARCLSSSAWKHGAAREPLGEKWDECFEVVERMDLKEGKPKKGVQCIPNFISDRRAIQ